MKFLFDKYNLDYCTGLAEFHYGFDDGRKFTEKVQFEVGIGLTSENKEVLDRAMFLAFVLIGTSYYKTFPTQEVELNAELDSDQAKFFNKVYHEGLGQFAYENGLARSDLAVFRGSGDYKSPTNYKGEGDLVLQSGGKDSLLLASWLEKNGRNFTPFYVSSGDHYPKVLDDLENDLVVARRSIDREALEKADKDGGMNGHVPVTYIVMSLAVIQAISLGERRVLVSIGHEGAEANAHLEDGMEVNHQWSKSLEAELDFMHYVQDYISGNILVGSPLRGFSELLIAELFNKHAWEKFGKKFSSCNVANYRQHADNSELKWCGDCPKCANSYLIFSPFVRGDELRSLFDGQELYEKESLEHAFKGLVGVDGVMKPFECVGEIDELRRGYHLGQIKDEYGQLPFEVPCSKFAWRRKYGAQEWAKELVAGIEELDI